MAPLEAFQNPEPNMSMGNAHNVWKVDPSCGLFVVARAEFGCAKSLSEASGTRPSFILVILPAPAADIRKSVKQWGDVMMGVPTQCGVSLTLSSPA